MRGFAMRLFHMGRNVAVWGDMTTPEVGPGDLLVRLRRPRRSCDRRALSPTSLARRARGRPWSPRSPSGELARHVDIVTVIPAQTMADDRGGKLSVLPMGSLFETAQMIAFELAILRLRPRFNETAETMRARHTNLE